MNTAYQTAIELCPDGQTKPETSTEKPVGSYGLRLRRWCRECGNPSKLRGAVVAAVAGALITSAIAPAAPHLDQTNSYSSQTVIVEIIEVPTPGRVPPFCRL
ncbi:hypothetical protein [Nocardia brasiliensis]|uniref:hypothetical protein n=1 Tax=Nocardia brasiliensis TaxID=37326 RepID=UPI0024584589|nr:hypothetical protein [Nocardia brasiliensis]